MFILETNDCHEFFFAVRIVRRALARFIRTVSKFVMMGWWRKLRRADFRSFMACLQSSLIQGLFGLLFLVDVFGNGIVGDRNQGISKEKNWILCVERSGFL